jgi:2-oxoglutarate dehydrogenase E2 component (dihydrolipoamide succinyltransferase)
VADATVGRWLKAEGDAVKSGDPLVELETDKINFEVEAEQDGVLESIRRSEGDTVNVGEVIGTIGGASGSGDGAASASDSEAAESGTASGGGSAPTVAEAERPEDEQGDTVADEGDDTNGHRASPSVRKLAQEYDVDLSTVSASGSGGRVTREDVERAIREQYRPAEGAPSGGNGGGQAAAPQTAPQAAAPQAAAPQSAPSGDGRGDLEEHQRMSRRRQTIARRLVEAQQTAAMLTTFNEVDMGAVMELRKRRKEEFQQRTGQKLGFMSFFTKAAIGALKAFPKVNSELRGDELILKRYYDIGVAVNTDDGLVVPVVRDADRKGFAQIEGEISELAVKAREGKLGLQDLQGGTFTITNGGIFGSLMSTPILNTPQVGILGMHKIQDRPMVVGGEIQVRSMMYLALSYDHRIIDGADAVRFLVRVKELIEDPETLLLEG